MKILITGSTGLIGSRLALHLAGSGHEVHALFRSRAKASMLDHPGITLFNGSVEDADSLQRAMHGCSQVYHLAAFTGVWHRDVQHYKRINVEGTRKVLDVATAAGVASVVLTSTAGVLGPSSGFPLDETAAVPESFFTHYEKSKRLMEEMVAGYTSEEMKVVIVNPSRLYGPGPLNKSNSVTRMLVQYLRGKWHLLPGNGNGIGNYAFIDDVVQGHIFAMEKGKHLQRYILGGENLSYRDLFRIAGKVRGSRFALYSFPLQLMLMSAAMMKLLADITGREPLVTPGWVRKYNHDWLLSSERAISELGYTVTPFEDGIKEIIKHYNL